MNGKTSRKRGRLLRRILLLLALLCVMADGTVGFLAVRDQRRANARMQSALKAMLLLKEIEDLAEGSGRAQRIYRLSGNRESLEAYHRTQAALPRELQRLRAILSENAESLDGLD